MPEKFDNEGTDFQSLTSRFTAGPGTADPSRPGDRAAEAQWSQVADSVTVDRRRIHVRTATDSLIDITTPLLVFTMVFVIVWFLLDVRFVYTEVHDLNLRIFAFCLVMGVVALNRLIARDGSDESIIYTIALMAMVAFYTYLTTSTYDVGSVARNFLDSPGMATIFNMTIVGFLWWLTNRLTHECCVDTNPKAGNVGLLTGVARDFRRSIDTKPEARKAKKKAVSKRPRDHLFETMEIEPYDPTEWKPPEELARAEVEPPSTRPSARHPGMSVFYVSIPVMAAFALGLPVLLQGGPPMVLAGHLYVGVYTFCALMLLLLSSLGSLREFFRSRSVYFPATIGWWWLGLGLMMVATVLVVAASLPMPGLPGMAAIEEHEIDFWSRDSTFRLQSPSARAAVALQETRIVSKVRVAVLVVLSLVAFYGLLRSIGAIAAYLGRHRIHLPQPVERFFNRVERWLDRYLRVPDLSFTRRTRISRELSKSITYANPLRGTAGGSPDEVRDVVAQSYDALCALAADLNKPKDPDLTPFEFVENLPKELRSLREEARELAAIYVRSQYSLETPDPRVYDRLRKFWTAYEKVRRGLVR